MHPLLAAVAETPHFFAEIAAILVIGAVVAYVAFRFGLVPIVGFLLAGVLIGPSGLGLVRDRALVDAAAEVGVILLLFTIGIEFSMEKLSRIKRLIFIGGGLQVVLASVLTMGLLAALGVAWKTGLYTGFLLALSSTVIVLKLLADRGETNSEQGQAALGILIFQDLAVVAMVLVVPMMGGAGGSALDVGVALGKAALIIALVLLFARRVMPRLVEAVARTCSPEIFLLTIIAICFGTAYLTSLAGVSLSLGAFLAGLVVSESPFSEHALGEILPLQILFSATFFISVGMLLDLGFLVQHLPLVLAAIGLVLLIKLLTTGAAVAVLRARPAITAATALMLAQVGEFSFVLERVGAQVGLFPAGLAESGSQAFIAATVLLMVGTPALSAVGGLISRRLDFNAGSAAKARMEDSEAAEVTYENAENHVIVAGYGRAARQLAHALGHAGIPFVITTLSPAGANEAEEAGHRVLRGDSSRQRTLQLAGIERAKMLVIADDDPAMAERIAAVARTLNPTMRLVVRTRYESEVAPLHGAGTDRVITEELESVLQVFAEVLRTYRIAPEEIEAREEVIRQGDYAGLVDVAPGTIAACNLDADCLDARTVVVRETAPAAGSTIHSLDLGHRFGIVVDRVRRAGTVWPRAELDFVLAPGDELDLRGTASSFASAAALFRTTRADAEDAETAVATHVEGIDMERTIELKPDPKTRCQHASSIRPVTPSARGCEDCLKTGSWWVHLRICMTCGHMGCCDSSPNKHATKHWHATSHPIVRSMEKGEDWGWCYTDQEML